MKIKVENESLVRDTTTNAILEIDTTKLNKYRAIRRSIKDREHKIDYLAEKINKLELIIERMNNGDNIT
jgi:DNA-dependent RNA polymerase auxiliary subunit epsilon